MRQRNALRFPMLCRMRFYHRQRMYETQTGFHVYSDLYDSIPRPRSINEMPQEEFSLARLKFFHNRKPVTLDYDHMKALHEECIEQLELMKGSLKAAQLAGDTMRDRLDDMAQNHWETYLDILHLLSMHDADLGTALEKAGLDLKGSETPVEKEYQLKRVLILSLTDHLIRRHQRMIYVYIHKSDPTKDYLLASLPLEREYFIDLIEMMHTLL